MKTFPIIYPSISSGQIYKFTSDKGIEYEVRFARKEKNPFYVIVVFGVLNEEFEGEEYSLTNKGEVYAVMATIVLIIKKYFIEHPNIKTVEFVGEPTASEDSNFPTKRLNLYQRYLPQLFDDLWEQKLKGNRMTITKKRKRN